MIYLLFFIFTIFIFCLADYSYGKNKFMSFIFVALGCIPLSLLAAYRADTIGTDVMVYVKPIFKLACSTTNLFFLINTKANTEIGFLLLNWVVTRFTSNFSVYLFIIEYLIMIFFAIGLYRMKNEKISIYIGMMLFCFLFYNRTLNIVRQMLAVSIIFMNLKDLFEDKKLKFAITILIASIFHSSAILMLPIVYLNNIKSKKIKNFAYILLIVFLLFYEKFTIFLVNKGILTTKYLSYLNDSTAVHNINFSEEIIRIIFIFILYFRNKNLNKNVLYYDKIKNFIVIDFILLQLGSLVAYANRISWYFFIVYIFAFSNCIGHMKKNKSIFILGLFILLVFYWRWSFIYCGYGETYPYKSRYFY